MTTRDDSRQNYTSAPGIDWSATNTGSLQRIADATEKMAQNWVRITDERDRYYGWWKEERERRLKLERQLLGRTNALRGVITKLRAKSDSVAIETQSDTK